MGVYSLSKSGINNWSKFSNVAANNGQTSDFELIGSQFLISSVASVSFTNLQNYSQYKHLQIRYNFRDSRSAIYGEAVAQINGDTGTNYSRHSLRGGGSSVISQATSGANVFYISGTGDTAPAGAFSGGIMDILDFSSTVKNKALRSLEGRAVSGDSEVLLRSAMWVSTSAITSMIFTANGANFLAGSRFSLYGVK